MSQAYRGLGFVVVLFALGAVVIKAKAQAALHLSDTEALAVAGGCFAAMCILWGEWIDGSSRLIMDVAQWGWLTALIIIGGYGWQYYTKHPEAFRQDADKVKSALERPVVAIQPAAPTGSGSQPADVPAPVPPAAAPPTSDPAAAEAAAPAAPPTPRQLRTPVRFKCARRWYGVDYVICSDDGLMDKEAGLEEAYDAVRAALIDAAGKTRLAKEQQVWSKQFGQDCGLPAIGAPSSITREEVQCVARALADRTAFLQGRAAPATPTPDAGPAGGTPSQPDTTPAPQPAAQPDPAPAPVSQDQPAPPAADAEALLAVQKGTIVRTVDRNNVFDVMASAYSAYVDITAKTTSLVLKKVVINRGNCDELKLFQQLPTTLKFGESYRALIACNAIEVAVETDQGNFTFTFDR